MEISITFYGHSSHPNDSLKNRLLRCALHTWALSTLLIVRVVCVTSAARLVQSWVDFDQVTLVDFSTLWNGVLGSWWQDRLQLLQLLLGCKLALWELDRELDEQVTLVTVSVDGHT